jgi:hypothetical protein
MVCMSLAFFSSVLLFRRDPLVRNRPVSSRRPAGIRKRRRPDPDVLSAVPALVGLNGQTARIISSN